MVQRGGFIFIFPSALHCAAPPKSATRTLTKTTRTRAWAVHRAPLAVWTATRRGQCSRTIHGVSFQAIGRGLPRLRDVQRNLQPIYASRLSLPSLRSLLYQVIEKNTFNADSKQIDLLVCAAGFRLDVIRCLQATPHWCGSNCNSMQIEQPMHGLLDQISLT